MGVVERAEKSGESGEWREWNIVRNGIITLADGQCLSRDSRIDSQRDFYFCVKTLVGFGRNPRDGSHDWLGHK